MFWITPDGLHLNCQPSRVFCCALAAESLGTSLSGAPQGAVPGSLWKGSAPTLRQALQFCAVWEGLGPQLLMELQSHRAAELGHWGEDACLYWKGRVEEGLPRVSECPGRVLCDREEGGPVHSSAQSDL